MKTLTLKSIRRHDDCRIYVADESVFTGERLVNIGDSVSITVNGSKDTYYLNMSNAMLHVWRPRFEKDLKGCVIVRDREEYNTIYNLVLEYRLYGMPENMFTRLDREWENRHKV